MRVNYQHGKHRAPVETAELHSGERSDKAPIPSHKHSTTKPGAALRVETSGTVPAHAASEKASEGQHSPAADGRSASTAHRSDGTHSHDSARSGAATANPANRSRHHGPDGSGASGRGKHAMDTHRGATSGAARHNGRPGNTKPSQQAGSSKRHSQRGRLGFPILPAAVAGVVLVLLICFVLNVQQRDSARHSQSTPIPTVTAVPTPQPTPTPTPLPTPTPTPTPVPTPTPPTTLPPDKAWPMDMHGVSGSYQTDKTLGLPECAPVDNSYFDGAVFVGDSITLALRNYVTQQRKGKYPDMLGKAKFLTTGSFGIHDAIGPVTQSSIHPVIGGVKMTLEDALAKMNAKKVFLMLGMNDIAFTGTDKSISNMGSLLKRIREKLPDALIFVQSVTPRLHNTGEPTTRSIFSYNKQLYQQLAPLQPEGIYFVDVAYVMRDSEGYLKEKYCSDPDGMAMHFTFDGCLEWIKFLYTHTPYAEPDNNGTDDTILPAPEDLLDESPLAAVVNDG